MNKLIYLSPSDQINNKYAYGNTNEAIQCRKIANACETALERYGFSVINNQKSNMYERVKESNAKKAAIHVCIHTNAFNKKTTGTRIFVYSLKGEGYKAAKEIYDVLAPFTPGTSENIKTADYYEIMNTNAICVYIEVDFHDVKDVAKWIIEHTSEIGEKIAEGICNYCGVKYVKKTNSKGYLVKVKAEKLNIRLGPGTNYGISGVIKDKGTYTIVEERNGFGKLKSGKGWISINSKYVTKV